MLTALYIYNMVNRNLVSQNADMQWQGQLVESLPSQDAGSAKIFFDGKSKKMSSTWILRESAKWGDGTPVTCEDFKFTWQIAQNLNVTIVNRNAYEDIQEVQCDTLKTKKMTFIHMQAKWDFYKQFQFYVLPRHLEKPIFDKYSGQKEGYDKNSNYSVNPTLPGLYNGPYLVSEIKPGSHIILKINPEFFGKKPQFKTIVIKFIADTNALMAQLVAGEINMISPIGISVDQALVLERRTQVEKLPYKVNFINAFTYEHVDFNLDNPILKDLKVRQALVRGLDRDAMVAAFFENKQIVAPHFLPMRDPWYEHLPSQLKKMSAKKSTKVATGLLEQAGWMLKKDGYRYKGGKKLSLEFTTTSGNRIRETVQTFIQAQMKALGVEILIKNFPPRVFFSDILKNRKFEGLAMYAWTFLPENAPTKFYSAKEIPTKENGWTGRNYMGWKNKIVEQSLLEMETSFVPKQRENLIAKIITQYQKDQPTIPLFYRADVSVTPAKMENYHPTGNQQIESLFVEEWKL